MKTCGAVDEIFQVPCMRPPHDPTTPWSPHTWTDCPLDELMGHQHWASSFPHTKWPGEMIVTWRSSSTPA